MNNNLKRRIMSRVYLEYAKNIFLEYTDYLMFGLFVSVSFMLVSIRDVLNNLPKESFPETLNFLVAALRNTSWIIQALIAGFVARVIFFGAKLAYKNARPGLIINKLWFVKSLKS